MSDAPDLQEVHRLLLEINQRMERYQHALLDPGGAFEKLRTDLSTQIREVNDHVTGALLRVGLLEKPPQPDDEHGEYRVLVVDDEPTLVATFSRILERYGFTVAGARDGKEALLAISNAAFDVVLCDMYMPGNGSTLCEHVVKKHPETTVVLMTGAEERASMQRAIELGAVHCLMKPFPNEQVVLTLKAAARIARASRRSVEIARSTAAG